MPTYMIRTRVQQADGAPLLLHPVRPLGQSADPPLGAGPRWCRPLVSLPGRVALHPGPGSLSTGRIEGALGCVEAVACGIERLLGPLHRSQGVGGPILGRGQPAPQLAGLPDRLAALPRPVCHLTIIPGGQADQRAPTAGAAGCCCPITGIQRTSAGQDRADHRRAANVACSAPSGRDQLCALGRLSSARPRAELPMQPGRRAANSTPDRRSPSPQG